MSRSKITFRMSSYAIVIILLVVGFALSLVASIKFDTPYNWWKTWGNGIAASIGSVLLSSGLISLLMEISTIQNTVSLAIQNLIKGEIDFSNYSKKELDRISKKVAVARTDCNMTENELKNSLYKYEENLLGLLGQPYYDYQKCKTVLYPDSTKEVFKKKVETEYKIINRSKKGSDVVMNWAIYEKDLKDEKQILEKFKVGELMICGKKYSQGEICDLKSIRKVKEENYDTYDYIISLNLPYKEEEIYTVKYKIEYEIPYSDITQIYKMTRPCKNLQHEFFMKKDIHNKDVWKMDGNAFTTFFEENEEEFPRFKVDQIVDETIKISFDEWALPGAGYVILSEKI